MYELLAPTDSLSQGDIIDGCPVFALEPTSGPEIDLDARPGRWRIRAVVLTQACDLAQTKTERVLVASVHAADNLVAKRVLKAPLVRDQIRRGLVYGWYFLPAGEPPVELAESIVDLHDLHTVSRSILQWLIGQGQRVCRIRTPYREHLAQHFGLTYMRIGLPEPYPTQTGEG
jgi:hypothetical protein